MRGHLVTLVAALAIPLVATQLWWAAREIGWADEAVTTQTLRHAELVVGELEHQFALAEAVLELTVGRFGVEFLAGDCGPAMDRLVAYLDFAANTMVIDADGTVLCTSEPGATTSAEGWSWFDELQPGGGMVLGRPIHGTFSDEWVLPMAVPITLGGEVMGSLVASLALVPFGDLIHQAGGAENLLVTVVSDDGTIVARSRDPQSWVGATVIDYEDAATAALLAGIPRQHTLRREAAGGEEYAWGLVTLDSGWIVMAGVPAAQVYGPVRRAVFQRMAGTFVILFAALLLAARPYKRISDSLRDLRERLRSLALGEALAPDEDFPLEVRGVVDQFNATLARLWLTEESERSAQVRFESIFDNAVFGICTSTPDGRFLAVNAALVDMLGYDSREDLIAAGPAALYVDPEQRATLVESRAPGDDAWHEELIWKRKDGEVVTVRLDGRAVRDEHGVLYFQQIVQDVTEEIRREVELRHSQKMEAVGQLAGGVAHDLNNLLTVIGGNVDHAVEGLPPESPARRDLLAALSATDSAAALTRQLLAFSRKHRPLTQVVDAVEIIRAAEGLLERLLGEAVELVTELSAAPLFVEIDPVGLEQVLVNLAINARDAMPDGGVITVTLRAIRGDAGSDAGQLELVVRDDGTGIDPVVRDRIFEPFFTTKPIGQGTGLGLSTVYGIVDGAGGSVSVDSVPGEGALFRVLLPLRELVEESEPPAGPAEATQSTEGLVLVVDDEDLVRNFVCQALRATGFDVLEASGGAAALEIAHARGAELDLVVSDVVMPHMSGPELAALLTQEWPDLPILFVSGYSEPTRDAPGSAINADNLLQKPFTAAELRARVQRALASSAVDRAAAG